jgi:DNA-binding response OmpR family regulator
MKILVVDDSSAYLEYAQQILSADDNQVTAILITDPEQYQSRIVSEKVTTELATTDLLLVDKDIGKGYTSTRFVCVVRATYPTMPIIRWTGGKESTSDMEKLRAATIRKPNSRVEQAAYAEFFLEKVQDAVQILSSDAPDPMSIFDDLQGWESGMNERHSEQMRELEEISRLAEQDTASGRVRYFGIAGREAGSTRHQLGHIICDGILSMDDIRPYWKKIQAVAAKLEAADEIDKRFQMVADFIKAGKLEGLELVRSCY